MTFNIDTRKVGIIDASGNVQPFPTGGAALSPVDALLVKQAGDVDDTERLQRAIDYCHINGIPLVLNGGKYFITSLNVREGTTIHGNGAVFKKPNLKAAPYNMDDNDINWLRMMNVQGYSYSRAAADVTVIDGITFDGSCWDMWTTPSYIYEQSALLFCSADYNAGDVNQRLKLNITNCNFMNSFADGIHINYGMMVNISNCTTFDCFRGGIVFTAGNTICNIDNCILQGDLMNDGFDFEVDYMQSLGLQINMNNVQLKSAELDLQIPENSTLNINNLTMTGNMKGYTTLACGLNSLMTFTNSRLQFNKAGTSESRLLLLGDVKFHQCQLVSCDTAFAVFYIWVSPYDSTAKSISVSFEGCIFDNIIGAQYPSGIYGTALESDVIDFKLSVIGCTFTKNCGAAVKIYGGDLDFLDNNVNSGAQVSSHINVDTYYSHFLTRYYTFNISNNRFNVKTSSSLISVSGFMTKTYFNNVCYDDTKYQKGTFTVLPWNAGADAARTNVYASRNTIMSAVSPPTCPVMVGDMAVCNNGDLYRGKLSGTTVSWVLI